MAVILSLCDYTGNWSRPYEEAGYDVIRVDLAHGQDVRLMKRIEHPVRGILAAPPCTHFSRAGAVHWKRKGDAELLEGLSVVDACLRAVAIYSPWWWALENPIGRLKDYLGEPSCKFDPCDFGVSDWYTKRTWLWGSFNRPEPTMLGARRAVLGSLGGRKESRDRTSQLRGGDRRRSETPMGFARAFFAANP